MVQKLPCFNERVLILWDPLIKAWIAANNSHLKGLVFDDFLAEFRDEWPPKDWEADTRADIVNSNLDPLKSASSSTPPPGAEHDTFICHSEAACLGLRPAANLAVIIGPMMSYSFLTCGHHLH